MVKDRRILNARDKLRCQMLALNFLLLLNTETSFFSKAHVNTEDVITEFQTSCGMVTKEDASFLLQEMNTLFNRCVNGSPGCEANGSKQFIAASILFVLSEVVPAVVKFICVAGHYNLGSTFLHEIESKLRDCGDCRCTSILLGKWAVKLHSVLKSDEDSVQILTECTRAVRSLSDDLVDREAHAALEGGRLVVWAVENAHNKALSGPVILAWFSFLEEYQNRIFIMLKKVSVFT